MNTQKVYVIVQEDWNNEEFGICGIYANEANAEAAAERLNRQNYRIYRSRWIKAGYPTPPKSFEEFENVYHIEEWVVQN